MKPNQQESQNYNPAREIMARKAIATLKKIGDCWRANKTQITRANHIELYDLQTSLEDTLKAMRKALEKEF